MFGWKKRADVRKAAKNYGIKHEDGRRYVYDYRKCRSKTVKRKRGSRMTRRRRKRRKRNFDTKETR